MRPFIVFGLPRSRTAWLSRFLTHGDWVCGHDELRHMRSLDDLRAWFTQPCIGAVETAAAPWWRMLAKLAPDAGVAVIRRPVEQVVESLLKIPGLSFDREALTQNMRALDRKLGQIEARIPGALSVSFDSLNDEATCAALFEHCTGQRHDPDHWVTLAPQNIQINMPALVRYYQAYAKPLEKLGKIAKHTILTGMALRTPVSSDGVKIQPEAFDEWLRDAGSLFDEHLVQVGEAPGDWQGKNIPLMRALYDIGAMQIMTARCNGRMFGYLMTLISPSLVSKDVTCAEHATFFASPEFPGLGLKLQRAAAVALKSRGVDEIIMKAGVRGSGERIGSIYRRLGAQNDGQAYRLQLAEA